MSDIREDCYRMLSSTFCSSWEKNFLQSIARKHDEYLFSTKQVDMVAKINKRISERAANYARNH